MAICDMVVLIVSAGDGWCLYSYNGLFIIPDYVVILTNVEYHVHT